MGRFIESVEASFAFIRSPNSVSPCADERPERTPKRHIERLNTQDDVQILGCSEAKSGFFEKDVACSSADQSVSVGKCMEPLAKKIKPFYNENSLIICPRAV